MTKKEIEETLKELYKIPLTDSDSVHEEITYWEMQLEQIINNESTV
jgi:hypothetical protein